MPSFDVVSSVDMQEVKNALNQAAKEVDQRYDFKGTNSVLDLKEKESQIILNSSDKMKLGAMREILTQKLAKRGVSLKSCEFGEPYSAAGDRLQQEMTIKQGLKDDELKRINKAIKDSKLKVSSQTQGDQVRVIGKKRDDLQAVIAHLRSTITDLNLQYLNFRD